MMKINSEMVLRTCLPLPPAPEQDTLLERCAGVDNLLQGEHLILAKLCKTKSGLMQDLLTGKVRVKDDNSQEVTTHA
jgi:type I restriction enzyme S subunit